MAKDNEKKDAVQAAENAGEQKVVKDTKAATKKSAPKEKGKKTGFWKGVRQEMSRVIWPTRQELGQYTVLTVAFCALFAVGFWLIDTGFLAVLKAMFGVTLS